MPLREDWSQDECGRPVGCNPGCKLSATDRNSEQLRPPQSAESQRVRLDRSGLGAGRSQVQILSPRSRTPCKERKPYRRCIGEGCIRGAKIAPHLHLRRASLALHCDLATCDRKVWSRVVAGWLRPKRSFRRRREGEASGTGAAPIRSKHERSMRVSVTSGASVWRARDRTIALRPQQVNAQRSDRAPFAARLND